MKRRAFCASAIATLGAAALPLDHLFAEAVSSDAKTSFLYNWSEGGPTSTSFVQAGMVVRQAARTGIKKYGFDFIDRF